MTRRRAGAAAVAASAAAAALSLLPAALAFGLLHHGWNRWLLDDADGSVRASAVTGAVWAVFFGLMIHWTQRRAVRGGASRSVRGRGHQDGREL